MYISELDRSLDKEIMPTKESGKSLEKIFKNNDSIAKSSTDKKASKKSREKSKVSVTQSIHSMQTRLAA